MTEFFDPEAFMNTPVEGANATKLIPVPVGEYAATVKTVTQPRVVQTKNGPSVVLNVVWEPQDEDGRIADATKRDGATVRQTLWLDIGADGKVAQGEGVNLGLGRLREALKQNKEGKNWTPAQMEGAAARIKVTHEARRDDPATIDARVNNVTSL